MERPSEAAADVSAASCTYSQVVFADIPHSYPPSTPITCSYNLNAAYQPHSRDWVGIFKVGWSTTRDYHTFVWAEPCQDAAGQESVTMQTVFKEYYLPKDEIEFYQFCYVDSSGQVRGASTPFCFKTPEEQSSESSTEDDFLIITTQVEQSNREKAELQKELDQTMEEKESLKRALEKEREEAAVLKGQNEQKENERSQVVRDLEQIREENGNLKSTIQQQRQEMDNLKEEMLVQATKQLEIQQQNEAEKRKLRESLNFDGSASLNETQEKYDRAVKKINQMKEERKELREKLDVQSEEISKLNSKLREAERELVKTRDSIHILEVDLQSSSKENERLSAELQKLQSFTLNMDEVRRENQELSRRLETQQETRQCTSGLDDDLKVRCQTLAQQLQDAQVKLAAEREEAKTAKRRAEHLEMEQAHTRKQLDNMCTLRDEEERKRGKYEMQLREALETIADREVVIQDMEHKVKLEKHEKDELIRENQRLMSDLEGLRRGYSDLHTTPPDDSTYEQPDDASAAEDTPQAWQQDTADESDHLYEPIAIEEEEEEQSLVCRHCQERFPGITRHELEQHEQSHRVCPFCTMICDYMEQSVFEDHVYGHEV